MNRPARYKLSLYLTSLLAAASSISARPVNFNEISLLVRCRESESSIRQEVTQRKLQRPLTTQQESTLRTQGASDSLIQSLRSSNLLASKEEAEAADSYERHRATPPAAEQDPARPRVRVFNVAYGQPINLSEFGGADYEIAFYSYRVAGEDLVQPAMIDNIRTGTAVSRVTPLCGTSESEAFSSDFFPTNEVRNWRFTPYAARGDLKDSRFNFSDSVGVSSRTFSRPLQIDWDSPVFIAGQPYTFYRVYGAGGVSLYYIGKASEQAAMVAVVSRNGS